MKNLLWFGAVLGLLALAGPARTQTSVITQPIAGHATPEAVSVATHAYTNVTSTQTRLDQMSALLIDNPSTNTATMHGHIGNCTSTAMSTTTFKGPIELAPSASGGFLALAADECLWLISRHASAPENVMVQGVRQKR